MKGLFEEQDSLVCCPLRRSGDTFSFQSLQECFAALHMADQLCEWQLKQPLKSPIGLDIGEKFITDDVAVLKFLAQLVDQRVWAYRRQGQAATDADTYQHGGHCTAPTGLEAATTTLPCSCWRQACLNEDGMRTLTLPRRFKGQNRSLPKRSKALTMAEMEEDEG